MDTIAFFQLATGACWSLTYLLIIYRGFQDKSYGMPMAALCANLSWEFIFSFVYPHGGLQGTIDKVWLALDAVILIQYILYGKGEFTRRLPIKYFYPVLLLTLCLCTAIIMASVPEFSDPQGKYAAFSQNLMMSVLFISMLLSRGNSRGQSCGIAFFKMIGSLISAVGFYMYFRSDLITIITAATLLFDLIYLVMITRQRRVEVCFKPSINTPG